jgi:hypothetical protein
MAVEDTWAAAMSERSDVVALVGAGALALLAGADAELVLAPGARAAGGGLATRATWVAEHASRWQVGWVLWVPALLAVTWALAALARHLVGGWRAPAVGAGLIAAAVGTVGAVVAVAAVPHLAHAYAAGSAPAAEYAALDSAVHGLVDVAAAGLYALAGLLLVPAMVATEPYPPSSRASRPACGRCSRSGRWPGWWSPTRRRGCAGSPCSSMPAGRGAARGG